MAGMMQNLAQDLGHGLSDLGQVVACPASSVQGQTLSLRRQEGRPPVGEDQENCRGDGLLFRGD